MNAVAHSVGLEHQSRVGFNIGRCMVRTRAVVAGPRPGENAIQRIDHCVEDRGFAGARGTGNDEEPALAERFEVDNLLARK